MPLLARSRRYRRGVTSSRVLMMCWLVVGCAGVARLLTADGAWAITSAVLGAVGGLALAAFAYITDKSKRQPRQ